MTAKSDLEKQISDDLDHVVSDSGQPFRHVAVKALAIQAVRIERVEAENAALRGRLEKLVEAASVSLTSYGSDPVSLQRARTLLEAIATAKEPTP